ncbi:MAG: acyl carrier protein [Acidobacteriia bacterium]|nr:acyl carrier protein [Terriglobia bacterium]
METAATEQRIRSFIEATFFFGQIDSLQDSDSFLDHGIIDSTGILELIAFLQDEFGIRVEDEEATPDNLDSIDKVSSFLRRKLDGARSASAGREVEGK